MKKAKFKNQILIQKLKLTKMKNITNQNLKLKIIKSDNHKLIRLYFPKIASNLNSPINNFKSKILIS